MTNAPALTHGDAGTQASRYRLLGIPGSLRARAFSTLVLEAVVAASTLHGEYDLADIGVLPHFNQDLYVDPLPTAVLRLREQIALADAVVISSPEYNHGIPGVLKNALDWASRPHNGSPLKGKPVLIITSSPAFTGGVRAQYQIRETIVSALARPVATPEIVVGLVHTKIVDGRFHDPAAIDFALGGLMTMFEEIDRSTSDRFRSLAPIETEGSQHVQRTRELCPCLSRRREQARRVQSVRTGDAHAPGGIPGQAWLHAYSGGHRVRKGRPRNLARRHDDLHGHSASGRHRESAGDRSVEPLRKKPRQRTAVHSAVRAARYGHRHTIRLNKFEGPDPAFWCAHGYAVCNPDPRGAYHSEGDIRVWSQQEGEDYYDLIEWLGVQDWCNGKVGTTGNSYLCISQWFVAAEQPPHLAAIAPWEGMSDIYRDLVVRGGIPDYPFPRILETSLVGNNLREDLVAEAEQHPLVDALWESKIPAFDKITSPRIDRGELFQLDPHSRHVSRLAQYRFGAEVAAYPQHHGVAGLLRTDQSRRSATLFRSLSERYR